MEAPSPFCRTAVINKEVSTGRSLLYHPFEKAAQDMGADPFSKGRKLTASAGHESYRLGGNGPRHRRLLPADTSSVRRKMRVGDQHPDMVDLARQQRTSSGLLRTTPRGFDVYRARGQHRGHRDDHH